MQNVSKITRIMNPPFRIAFAFLIVSASLAIAQPSAGLQSNLTGFKSMGSGGFQFTIVAPTVGTFSIQVSTNFSTWTLLTNLIGNGQNLQFTDLSATKLTKRFYRVTGSPLAPSITTPPLSQTVAPGAQVNFSIVAFGTPPLSYQWFYNGSSITGATSSAYSITSAQTSAAGNYTVIVSNSAGFAVSQPAASLSFALAPSTIAGKNISCVIASGISPFANSGSYLFEAGSGGSTYVIAPTSGNVLNSSGAYTYTLRQLIHGDHLLLGCG